MRPEIVMSDRASPRANRLGTWLQRWCGRVFCRYGRFACAVGLILGTGCAAPPPQTVVEQAIDAARNEDRKALLDCFTPRSRPLLETWWRASDTHNPALAKLGAAAATVHIDRIVPGLDGDPDRAILVVREGPESMRIVVHRLGGMWRIDLLDTERVLLVQSQ